MTVGLIIYDKALGQVLVNERKDLSLFESKLGAANYYQIAESSMAQIFTVGEVPYYLVDASQANLPETADWLPISQLVHQTAGFSQAWQRLANYLYRTGDLAQEQTVIALKSEDIDLTVALMAKIIENNPGISLERNSRDKIIVLDAANTETSDLVLDLSQLDYTSLDELYWQVMSVIAWQFSQKVHSNARFNYADFYGLAGLTAAGKSQFAQLSETERVIWPLKVAFFVETANLLVDMEATQLRDFYAIQLIMDFVNQYQDKAVFILDEIFSENFHQLLKEILGSRYSLIYMEALVEVRQSRTLESEDLFKANDAKRVAAGVDRLKNQASLLVDANMPPEALVQQMKQVIQQL